jgi:hypothetical protein
LNEQDISPTKNQYRERAVYHVAWVVAVICMLGSCQKITDKLAMSSYLISIATANNHVLRLGIAYVLLLEHMRNLDNFALFDLLNAIEDEEANESNLATDNLLSRLT